MFRVDRIHCCRGRILQAELQTYHRPSCKITIHVRGRLSQGVPVKILEQRSGDCRISGIFRWSGETFYGDFRRKVSILVDADSACIMLLARLEGEGTGLLSTMGIVFRELRPVFTVTESYGCLYLAVDELLDCLGISTALPEEACLIGHDGKISDTCIGRLECDTGAARGQGAQLYPECDILRIIRLESPELLCRKRCSESSVISENDYHVFGIRVENSVKRMYHLAGIGMLRKERLVVLLQESCKLIHSHILVDELRELQPHILIVSRRRDEKHGRSGCYLIYLYLEMIVNLFQGRRLHCK